MWKDMLIIIHLPSNYTPGDVGHQSCLLLSASTAGLPARAAGLSDREVTTRGQPHAALSHSQTHRRGRGGGGGGGEELLSREEGAFISWLAVSFLSVCCYCMIKVFSWLQQWILCLFGSSFLSIFTAAHLCTSLLLWRVNCLNKKSVSKKWELPFIAFELRFKQVSSVVLIINILLL